MKKALITLALLSSAAMAKNVQVYAEKLTATAGCYSVLSCSTWQGEYECERSGTKMFFDDETQSKLDLIPEGYTYKVSSNCRELDEIGAVKRGQYPKNLQSRLNEKGTEVEVVIYPDASFYFENL